MTSLTVTLTHDPAALDRLETEWQALQDNSATDGIYMTWEWVKTWWQFFGHQGELWLLEAREEGGRLVGLGPLMLVKYSPLRGLSWRQLQFISTSSPCEHLDFIIERGAEDRVIKLFLDRLQHERSRWDMLNLDKMLPVSANLPVLKAGGIPWQERPSLIAPVIYLPQDWETFYSSLSKKKRKNLRRYQRALEESYHDQWVWKVLDDPAELDGAFDKMIALHQAKWVEKGQPGAFADPQTVAFYRAIAQRFLKKGWLVLSRLWLGSDLVVISLAYLYRQRFYDFVYGVDYRGDINEISPGHLSTEMSIRYALEHGVKEYDFLWGDEEYKFHWNAEPRADLTLSWAASPRARLAQYTTEQAHVMWRYVKRALPSKWRQRVKQSTIPTE